MPAGPTVAFLLLAQAATASEPSQHAYGPTPAAPAKAATVPSTERECAPQSTDPKANEIVVCAVKPQGYRLPPDIVEARRLKKQGDAGRPRNPHETYADRSCATGPMGCRGVPTVDFLALAAVAAQISQRLAKGQEVGSVFKTTPSSSEYQYYLEAKREREDKEAKASAAAVQAKAQAEEAGKPAPAKPQAAAPARTTAPRS